MVKSMRFADDKAVVASSEKMLQEMMDNINRVTQDYRMEINVNNTKVMCISREGENKLKIYIDAQEVEKLKTVQVYLGNVINADGYCDQDVKSKIAMGKIAFIRKKNLYTDKQIRP